MADGWEMTKLSLSFRHSTGFPCLIFYFKLKKNVSSVSLLRNSAVVSLCCRSCLNKWQINYTHVLSCQHFALDNRHVILKVRYSVNFIIPCWMRWQRIHFSFSDFGSLPFSCNCLFVMLFILHYFMLWL